MGQYPLAPPSPGPFVLLLNLKTRERISDNFLRFLVLVCLQGLFLIQNLSSGDFFQLVSKILVHRIAAFAFAFAMAIPHCQWRHRCVATLGEILVVLYRKPLWRKAK